MNYLTYNHQTLYDIKYHFHLLERFLNVMLTKVNLYEEHLPLYPTKLLMVHDLIKENIFCLFENDILDLVLSACSNSFKSKLLFDKIFSIND